MLKHNKQTFRCIQSLRGLAACMVVIYHSTQDWWVNFGDKSVYRVWDNGASGVDIFFVISGFVMAASSIDGGLTASMFLKKRLVRIVPLYWLMTLVMLLRIWIISRHPGMTNGGPQVSVPLPYIISSALFAPYRNSLNLVQPILPVGWTLSFEMFFYGMFALALYMRVNVVKLLSTIMIPLVILGLFHKDSWPSVTTLFDPLLLEFLGGVLLGYAVNKGVKLGFNGPLAFGVMGLLGLLTLHVGNFPCGRLVTWGVPALLLVVASVMLEEQCGNCIPDWAMKVGDASYSLYLVHAFVLMIVVKIIKTVFAHPNLYLMIAVGLVSSILVSLLTHGLVEVPVAKLLKIKGKQKPAVAALR